MAQIQEERRNRKSQAPASIQQVAPARFRPGSWAQRSRTSAVDSGASSGSSTGQFPSLGGLADRQQARVSVQELAG